MAQRGGYHRGLPRLLPAKARERAARSHFQERTASSSQQSPNALVEPHGVSEMTDPVCRVGRFGLCDPGAGQVGHKRSLRLLERDGSAEAFELRQDWPQHRRVGGAVDVTAGLLALIRSET